MGMCVRNAIKILILLVLLTFLGSCAPIDFPSFGNYRINLKINGLPLDECSFVRLDDTIRLSFEESVANDPDITGLMVYLRDSTGVTVGWRVLYELDQDADEQDEDTDDTSNTDTDNETEDEDTAEDTEPESSTTDDEEETVELTAANNSPLSGQTPGGVQASSTTAEPVSVEELVIRVRSLDSLPAFPIPNDLPMGRYTIVSQVMGGRDILQRIEKVFFYLGHTDFSYENINVYLPGIAESTQFIPRGTVIMLKADLSFDAILDPYIIWYNGRTKISEGKFSDGFGYIFWRAPEESGFFTLRAVVYPIENYQGLSGFQKEVSLLVSSKPIDIHLVSQDSTQLIHWYVLEGNLNDSKMITSAERALRHTRNAVNWRVFGGTYGVGTGFNNNINVPRILITDNDKRNWQMLFRFKPENDGGILSVAFGKSAFMYLYMEGPNLFLTLKSPANTVSQVYTILTPHMANRDRSITEFDFQSSLFTTEETELLSEASMQNSAVPVAEQQSGESSDSLRTWVGENSFLTVSIYFSVQSDSLSARLHVFGGYIDSKLADIPIVLETETNNEFQILLGYQQENIKPVDLTQEEEAGQSALVRHEFTALWDELALYCMSSMEIPSNAEQPAAAGAAAAAGTENDSSS
jgi:hypothetical protein